MPSNVLIIACSVFKSEIDHLKSIGKVKVPIIYLDSMLHMYPKKLQELLDVKIKENSHYKIVLVFGDCHARMVDYEKNANIIRTPGINCCEIFLGSDDYRKVRKEGAFILLPEWAARWKEVFVDYMGFKDAKSTTEFMTDMHKKLIYIDTGHRKVNNPLLNEISKFVGLPLEIHRSSIGELEKTLFQLVNGESATPLNDNDGR
jgi:hypothetical protein